MCGNQLYYNVPHSMHLNNIQFLSWVLFHICFGTLWSVSIHLQNQRMHTRKKRHILILTCGPGFPICPGNPSFPFIKQEEQTDEVKIDQQQ